MSKGRTNTVRLDNFNPCLIPASHGHFEHESELLPGVQCAIELPGAGVGPGVLPFSPAACAASISSAC